MNPKFKIGDRLIFSAEHTGYKPKFIVEGILLDGEGYWYREKRSENWMREKHLDLYTEPKKKVKKYLYALSYKNNSPTLSEYFHKDDSEFRHDPHGQITWYQRLDWAFIEVEE